jgi:cytochrome P450
MRISYFLAPDAYHASRPDARSAHRQPLLNDIRRMVSRRRSSASRSDLVDLLLKARDPETGQGMDDDLLANNLLGFILAGHETTALALTWALYLVAMHPPTAARIRDEVTEVAGTNAIDATHVDRLVFTRQVLSETLRLYPPAFQVTRVSRKRTELAGFPVQAGSRVIIPVYALHRHRGHWANPDAFDPDRFAPSASQPDRFTYLPFGAGPRICLGAAFAMMEAVTVLASLVRAIDFTVVSPHRVRPVAGLALRPAGGLPMSVRRFP